MKRLLFITSVVGIPACVVLVYVNWRIGTIVASRSFDGLHVQVREMPQVNGILANPPSVAESAFVVEVSQYGVVATHRFFQPSARVKPIEIVRLGDIEGHDFERDRTFEVRFSDVEPVGFRGNFNNGATIEWFTPTVWHKAFEEISTKPAH